jgi:chromosome segregation ATPase
MTEVKLDTSELRRVVSEEVRKVIDDLATIEDVDNHIVTRLAPYPRREEVQKLVDERANAILAPMMSRIEQGFHNLEQSIAVLIEQNRHNEETVKDVKTTQQRLDAEHEKLKEQYANRGERVTAIEGDVKEFRIDVFGSPDRQGTRSLVDHFNDGVRTLAETMGNQYRLLTQQIQTSTNGTAALMARIELVETKQAEHHAWIETRRKVERIVVQSIPRAGKRIGTALGDSWVQKWAIRLGIPGGLAVIAALLERLNG